MSKRWLAVVAASALPFAGLIPLSTASAAEPDAVGSSVTVEAAPDGDLAMLTVTNPYVAETRTADAAALAEGDLWSTAFGASDTGSSLHIVDRASLAGERTVTRMQQRIRGVDVYAGQLVAVSDERGALLTLSGGLAETPTADTWPRNAAWAQSQIRDVRARITSTRKVIFDESLIGGDLDEARTAWSMIVTAPSGKRFRYFIDAHTGATLHREALDHALLNRVVCDAGNVRRSLDSGVCTQSWAARSEGQEALTGAKTARLDPGQVNAGYETLRRTNQLFADIGVDLTELIGYDARDGNGKQLRMTIRYCPPRDLDSCPMANAFWMDDVYDSPYRGGSMYIGDGLVSSDDVTAHELTHGVTSATSNLVYYREPGAISESISDVFGELVDQLELLPGERAGEEGKWLIGENIKTPNLRGPVRSMSDPTKEYLGGPPQPDHMGSKYWWTKKGDDGGVHINSGVGNKAAYLIGHGGSFRGVSVEPLGLIKTARLYWEVSNRLPPSARYATLGSQLRQACTELAGAGAHGFTENDCANVDGAVRATQMTAQRIRTTINTSVVTVGQATKLNLQITDAVNQGPRRERGNVDVVVEARTNSASDWAPVVTRVTDADGRTSAVLKPTVTTEYRVSVPGSGPWSAAQTFLTVRVAARLSVIDRPDRGAADRPYEVTGTSSPATESAVVRLQVRSGGSWRTVDSGPLGAEGDFALTWDSPRAGSQRLRVVRSAGEGLVRTARAFTVRFV